MRNHLAKSDTPVHKDNQCANWRSSLYVEKSNMIINIQLCPKEDRITYTNMAAAFNNIWLLEFLVAEGHHNVNFPLWIHYDFCPAGIMWSQHFVSSCFSEVSREPRSFTMTCHISHLTSTEHHPFIFPNLMTTKLDRIHCSYTSRT